MRTPLPASIEAAPAQEIEDESLIQRSGRILLMDDDQAVRSITERMIRKLGFEVLEASHGAKALRIYQDHLQKGKTIDLVIVDLTVPRGMGGLETGRKLLEIDPGCRLVVSSGYSDDPVMANYHEYGFHGSLAKPFSLHQLSTILGQILDQS